MTSTPVLPGNGKFGENLILKHLGKPLKPQKHPCHYFYTYLMGKQKYIYVLPSPNNKKQNPNQTNNSESWILCLTSEKFLFTTTKHTIKSQFFCNFQWSRQPIRANLQRLQGTCQNGCKIPVHSQIEQYIYLTYIMYPSVCLQEIQTVLCMFLAESLKPLQITSVMNTSH